MSLPEQQSNLHITLLLRLMEVPLTDLNAIIQGYKQICEIEENHTTTMISLARQQHCMDSAHRYTSSMVSPLSKRPRRTPSPPSTDCPPEKSSLRLILDRCSNATYHGMSNLTARIFHDILSRGEPAMECDAVARGVLNWLNESDMVRKKTDFAIRPCNRRTGSLCMVYTRLPADDPVHALITGWILAHTSGDTKKKEENVPRRNAPGPDTFAFDPWTVWNRFQKIFPVMAIYKSQWVSTSTIAQAAVFTYDGHRVLMTPEELHANLHWPDDIDIRWVMKLAIRLYNEKPWAQWLVPMDQDTQCHIDSIGCLRRAACVLHGFLLGPKGSCANVWEAIIMPNRSLTALGASQMMAG
jgi:hypothetical protein